MSTRRNIRLAEAPSFGQTIFEYAPHSNGAQDYKTLAHEVAQATPAQLVSQATEFPVRNGFV